MKDAFQSAAHAAMHRTLPPELFSGLLAIAADAVIAMDDEQNIIFFNEGAERIFEWSAEEVGGQPLSILLPSRFHAAHEGHVRGFAAAHGRARVMGERQQISGRRKSGEEFPAEAAIQRLVVQGRDIYAAVLRDIGARQRAEEEIQNAIQSRDDMMGIVSHDLRNPANAVKMLALSILEKPRAQPLAPDVVESVEVIRQAAELMDALIQDLLDVTRLEAGRLSVSPKAVDASWLVSRSLDALRPIADAGGVELRAELADETMELNADPDRVLQLLSNIIGNAIKFSHAGGLVKIRASSLENEVLFEVSDSGEGIPAEQLPHVFDRFFQIASASRPGRRHGAGLGLPISRGIIEAHGGRIWVESEPGEGTTVRFTLPALSSDGSSR
jgi:PAS domain S-box-containing protein